MKLLIDVGNTSTTFAISRGEHWFQRSFVATHPLTTLGPRIRANLTSNVKEVWIASVVRGATLSIEKTFFDAQIHKILPSDFAPGNHFHLVNHTLEPEKVGVDRLVNAVAALEQYSGPLVILDCGTATTLCAIQHPQNYLGGAILPGLEIMREALKEKTSLLPSIDLSTPQNAIGRNTEEAMLSGIVYASACAIRGLFREFKKELGIEQCHLIGTGGQLSLVAPLIPELTIADPDLTLKGIAFIANANRSPQVHA